jgi:hypothetical protein
MEGTDVVDWLGGGNPICVVGGVYCPALQAVAIEASVATATT